MRHPKILKNPEPTVFVNNYGDFAIDYQLRFWIENYNEFAPIMDEVRTRIWYAFKNNDIVIPFPTQALHMRDQQQILEEECLRQEQSMEFENFFRGLPFM